MLSIIGEFIWGIPSSKLKYIKHATPTIINFNSYRAGYLNSMAKSDSKVELEALLAELQQKDNDLTLAGELGVSLVEKNSTLKSQLSTSEQEVIRLEEVSINYS